MNTALGKTGWNEVAEIDLVFFSAGGLVFAVESVKVRALREVEKYAALSMTTLLRLPEPVDPGTPPRKWLLCLVHPTGTLTVQVDEPITQIRLPATALYSLPPLLEARLTLPCVRALAYCRTSDSETLAVVLDPTRLPVP